MTRIPVVSFEREELLSAPPGLYFKFHHRLRTAELFSAKPFHFFQPIINDEIRSLLQVVADNAGCVHIRKELYDATFCIISRIAISRRAKDLRSPSQNDHSSSLQNLLIDSIDLLGVQNIGDYKPCLAWMDLQGAKRAKAISTKIKSMWQQIIDDRRRTRLTRGSEIKDSDFLDVLLTASAQDDLQLSDLAIKAVLTNMFDAGIDSSTLTVEWAIAELLVHPRILQKAQQKLEEVVGAIRLVQESDIVRLPYLRAIIKETMRLHPIAPLFMPHTVSESCRICGRWAEIQRFGRIHYASTPRDSWIQIWRYADKILSFFPLDQHVEHVQGSPLASIMCISCCRTYSYVIEEPFGSESDIEDS